jgi:amino acid transporter
MQETEVLVGPAAADARLDAGVSDELYLEELGYKPELKRVLGRFSSFALQYSSISFLGGILLGFTVGLAQIGPAMLWVWLVATGLQVVVALIVAELCSAYPVAGSSYNIVSRLGNRLIGWQVGWYVTIGHIASVCGATIAITPLIMAWFGVHNLSHWALVGISGGFILASTFANLVGVRFVAWLNNMSVTAELAGAGIVIIGVPIAIIFTSGVHTNTFHYFFTTQGTVKGSILLPLAYASLLSVYIVSAFDLSGTGAEETKKASSVVPTEAVRANVMSWLIGAAFIAVILLVMKDVSATVKNTDVSGPITFVLNPVLGHFMGTFWEVLAVFALFVNGIILQLGAARVFWAQARDGRFPAARYVTKLNKHRVPVVGIWIAGVISVLLTVYSSVFNVIIALLACSWAAAYGTLAVFGLRARMQGALPERPYELKWWKLWYPVAIVWSYIFIGVMVYQNPSQVGVGCAVIFVLGFVIYYVLVPRDDSGRSMVVEQGTALTPSERSRLESDYDDAR